MKLIDNKLGGTTPLNIIIKFPKDDEDESDDEWEMRTKMMQNIGLPEIK